MGKSIDAFYKNQVLYYKYLLYAASVALIVLLFPKEGLFYYNFNEGSAWSYENLYAPFDFNLNKSVKELEAEKLQLAANSPVFLRIDPNITQQVRYGLRGSLEQIISRSQSNINLDRVFNQRLDEKLNRLYQNGIYDTLNTKRSYFLPDGKNDLPLTNSSAKSKTEAISELLKEVNSIQQRLPRAVIKDPLIWLERAVRPNLVIDRSRTDGVLSSELAKIGAVKGSMLKGQLIIANGEIVEEDDFQTLTSLKQAYELERQKSGNFYLVIAGYALFVALVLAILFYFLYRFRRGIFDNNNQVTFIFFNIIIMVFVTTFVVKNFNAFIYAVPLSILPLIIKNFFDARLALFVHVLTILILGFVVPYSFEYVFLQTMAGIVTILSVSEQYKRSNLFISVGQITLVYCLGYLAFHLIQHGSITNIEWNYFAIFLLNGSLTLFALPLLYLYEKSFGLVSDVSLLELSNTNSKLLKELANKAPGTFHHSLQVANLAEACANQIGANAMLVRVGALYHDIGKIVRPTYFTENQVTNINPHDDLSPKESARIIIDHVIDGIELAQKHKIPDRIIDFLRTHHGTSTVYYFFKKEQEKDPNTNIEDFQYPGPNPFSKETAILMMADSVEAASKSLSAPTAPIIDSFVDKIIAGQLEAKQFVNANITLKEIETIKKVLKKKLANIYHLRIEYPE